MSTNPFEQMTNGVGAHEELVVSEQIEAYSDLMRDFVRLIGKGVRYARVGEATKTQFGTEYYQPYPLIASRTYEFGSERHQRTERERTYSASYRQQIGDVAGKLAIIEADTIYEHDIDAYNRKRRLYRISWDLDPIGIFQSEVLDVDIIADARTDGEVLEDLRQRGKSTRSRQILCLDHEQTVNDRQPGLTSGYYREINPFRTTEYPYRPLSAAEFDALIFRTSEYMDDFMDS